MALNLPALHQQIVALLNQGQFIDAHPLVVTLIQQSSSAELHAEGYFFLGVINSEIGQINKATQCFEKAVGLNAKAEYFAYLCKCYALLGELNQALTAADQVDVTTLDQANALDTLGVSLSKMGFHERAVACFERVVGMGQATAQYWYNFGMSLKFAGDFIRAKHAFESAIALEPAHSASHFALSDMGRATLQNNRIDLLQTHIAKLNDEAGSADAHLHFAHALAIEYQQIGQYAEAIQVLESAKEQKRATLNYDIQQDLALFEACQRHGDIESQPGYDSRRPIFIVGMPRSGTTLVERILSHHSLVGSGGELQDFGVAVKQLTQTPGNFVLDEATMAQAKALNMHTLGQRYCDKTRAIAASKPHFIDKLPFNFFYVHLIRQALPNAKVIVMLRDPMDTCIGNFRQMFSLNSPYYAYTYEQESVARFYAAFRQHIDFLQAQFGDAIHIQQYEALARDPEPHVKALLNFCELPFEAQCIDVHKNKTPVSTASKVQVREPINTSSIGRWKRFGDAINPLHETLLQHKLV